MKKFLQIPLAVSILCMSVGCGGDSTENPDPSTDPPTPPVTEDTIAFPDEVPPAPLFPEKGGEQTLSFTSAAAWTARVSDPIPAAGAGDATRAAADWLSVSPRSGAAGAATIRVVALPNDTDSDRTGIVTLQAGTASQLLTVTQLRRGALVAATESITVDNAGGEVPIVVSSNVEFDITIDGDWITPVETRALTRDTLRFRIDENRGYDNRMGTITFSSKDKTIEQEVKIYQAQQDALIVSPTDWLFDEKIWTFEIEVRANVEFTVENPDVVWLRPVETRGLKTHTLRYRVDENTTYDSRSAEIRIVDTKRNLSQTVTVTQSQKDALVVAESSYTMPQEGGEIAVEVTRNVPIDITIGAGWITQVETRGLITEQLRFRIAENPNTGNRESVIVFESKDHEIRQEVRIEQQGRPDEEAIVREYLVRLYRDTDGDNWRNNTNWCSDRPIDEWYGVNYVNGKLELMLGDSDVNKSNKLSGSIHLSGCKALVALNCTSNAIKSIDVSECTSLAFLYCGRNEIENLNISGCVNLTRLACWTNKLTNLNISNFKSLISLACDTNRISNLDVSGCTSLEWLNCSGNRMTSIDLSGCTALKEFTCTFNLLSYQVPESFKQLKVFKHDQRYNYYKNDMGFTSYTDNGYGWWYPGEPGKGYHGW